MSVVKAINLSLGYEVEPVLDSCNFEVKQKEFVFITGPSGSGKSTLLKSIYGHIRPILGDMIVSNISLVRSNRRSINFLRQQIGVIFQDYKLIDEWSIEDNIMLPLKIKGFSKKICVTQMQKLLQHVKLSHKIGKYPYELSGGEQQRVAVARALAHNPSLILADEPTGNLDEFSSAIIWDLLAAVNTHLHTTVLVVTHNAPAQINVNYSKFYLDNRKIYSDG